MSPVGLLTKHLMPPDDPVQRDRLAATVAGMAHFGATGPAGTSCRQCVHWGVAEKFRRAQTTGELRPRQCQKYPDLKQGDLGPAVPHLQPSCRYFVLAETVPEAVYRRPKKKMETKAKRTRKGATRL